jgi:hypothetical protein
MKRYVIFLIAALLAPLVVRSEIYADRPGTDPVTESARDAISRRIVIDGIPTVGRNWTADQDLQRFATQAIQTAQKSTSPIPARVQMNAAGMTLVQFLPAKDEMVLAGTARVLIARPTEQRNSTSVWEADVPVAELLRQAAASARGEAPGRDHPVLGALPAAKRVNVVEVVDRGYAYSAVYLASGAPAHIMDNVIAHLVARGAKVEARTASADDARAALGLDGRRIDFSVIRDPDTSRSQIVIQTNLHPKVQARESR